MYKKTMTYTDFDGVERTEDFLFNLSEAELVEMEYGITGGMEKMLKQLISEQDTGRIMMVFKDLILRAYGKKSADGKRFMKSDELRREFSETQAYSDMFMSFARDADAAADFVNHIIPAHLAEEAAAKQNNVTALPQA